MIRPAPGRPGSVDPSDVLDASRKMHSIGADIAASALRRCKQDTREAADCLHAALTHVNAHSRKPKSQEGKERRNG